MSKRALLQRINRKLLAQADGDIASAERVRATRGSRWRSSLGDYYLLDIGRNVIREQNVDLESFGRELGVLAKWERLEAD